MSIYDFFEYKQFFNAWVLKQPNGGHGEYRRVAQNLGVSTTMISQVFKGEKHLSLEMACELTEYLNLSDDETEYFLLLVEFNRAGSYKLQKKLEKQVRARSEKAKKIENRVKRDFELNEDAKLIFYSSWIYSGIRLTSSISDFQDVVSISQKLNLPRNQVQKVVDFLVQHGLCKQDQDGRITTGNVATHLGSSNLLVAKHHQNWRLQGFQKMSFQSDDDLFFTLPCALSKKDSELLRAKMLEWIIEIRRVVGPSDSETVRCLNIDWFGV